MRQVLSAIIISSFLLGCTQNAVTGRKQLSLVSESELQLMAKQQYAAFLDSIKPINPATSKDAEMVKRVGNRIASAIKQYYDGQGKAFILDGYQWEFNLVNNKEVNAWCMPGGKVVVYTGLLPVTQDETSLAIVLGHEITHALAQHGAERMSQGLLQQLGGIALEVAVSSKPAETQNLFMQAYGIGTTVGAILPFSRKEESEADKYGLFFAAMAGYDPREAVAFWERMARSGGSKPPEFLSDHPADETRIADIKAIMPEALKYYKPAATPTPKK